jgi:DNA-binding response OmpR family regulator
MNLHDPLLHRMKILIIDDAPSNVVLLEYLLRENGYSRIQSVTDARTAVETIATFRPDLILLDLMMPHVDGFAILEAVRSGEGIEASLPVVVLTADINEDTKRRALTAGATDFLCKPFGHKEMGLRIHNLLESRRAYLLLDNQRAALEDAVRERTAEMRANQ